MDRDYFSITFILIQLPYTLLHPRIFVALIQALYAHIYIKVNVNCIDSLNKTAFQ